MFFIFILLFNIAAAATAPPGSDIIFTGGSATARMFDTTKGFAVEVKGKAAQGGKAGMEAVNFILERNGLEPLPMPYQTVIDGFAKNDENFYNKLYYLVDRFIGYLSVIGT